MMKSNNLLYLLGGLLIGAASVFFVMSKTSQQQPVATSSVPTSVPLTSSPDAPTPVPITPQNYRGTVEKIDGTTLSIKGTAGTKKFDATDVYDIQRLTSTSMEPGQVKTEHTTFSSIAVGSEVYVIVDQKTGKVLSILISK